MKMKILGVPFSGAGVPPCEENPAQGLRDAGLVQMLRASGNNVFDVGDLCIPSALESQPPDVPILNIQSWRKVSDRLGERVYELLNDGTFALILGGDCSILVGIFAALSWWDSRVGLVFLDAHSDFHSLESSGSCQPEDVELAVLTGRGPYPIAREAGHYPMVEDTDIVAFGLRHADEMYRSNIKVYDKNRMLKKGISQAVDEGMGHFVDEHLPIWLHFDVDVLDPGLMPVAHPAPDGLSFSQAGEVLTRVMASRQVLGMSVTCYQPGLDRDGVAGSRLATLISNTVSHQSVRN